MLRKTSMFSALICALALAGTVGAQQIVVTEPAPADRTVGIGFLITRGAYVDARFWFTPRSALEARVGVDGFNTGILQISADYDFSIVDLVPRGIALNLPIYIGIGAQVNFETQPLAEPFPGPDVGFGIRVPVGIIAQFRQVPFDVFAEAVPKLLFSDPRIAQTGAFFDLTAGIGARFAF